MTTSNIIHAAWFTPTSRGWGLPILFWSDPGQGKTSILEQMAAACSMPIEVLSPGERGEGAFGVIPVPVNGVLTYPRPDWTEKFAGNTSGIVMVDEMTTAPPALQPALLGLMLNGRIGTHHLGPKVRMCAAANPPERGCGGFDLPPAVANRVCHIEWPTPTVADMQAYFMSLGGGAGVKGGTTKRLDVAEEEARVKAAWDQPFAQAIGLVMSFLDGNQSMRSQVPDAGSPDISRAWASPRSWEMATRVLATAAVHGLSQADKETMVRGCVGKAAEHLIAYEEKMDLPSATAILDGELSWKHNPKRLDVTHAVLTSCVALVSPPDAPSRRQRAVKLWEIIGAMRSDSDVFDICIPPITALVNSNLHIADTKGATKVLAMVNPILEAAGIKWEA